ncbi:choice-of-anchor D domain-containing protein [Halobellus rubicundus]|uniref:Choice-of-anchor D domain-containing protein n=1 Tax=Halobellus rubicundus TaxID=2996466 RepID=A0ABD5MGX0_9EURY
MYFEWRPTSENKFRKTPNQSIKINGTYNESLAFLTPGTTYEFRAVVESGSTTEEGSIQTLTTGSGGPTDGFIRASNNVALFNLFFQGLQVDVENSPVSIETGVPSVFLNAEGIESEVYPGDKGTVPVHPPDGTLTFDFEDTGSLERFDGSKADIVAVKTDSSEGLDAFSQITQIDDLLNDESSTVEVFETTTIGDNEEITYDLQADGRGSGNYIFLAVNNGSISVDEGNASIDNARVIGLDFAIVQSGSSTIQASRPEYRPGENVTVRAEADLPGDEEDITQAVILYDETDFSGGEITAQIDSLQSIDPASINVTSTISGFNGVRRIEQGSSLLGQNLGESDEIGIFTIDDAFGFIGGGIGDRFQNSTDAEIENASIVAKNATGTETTFEIGTLDSFDTSEYGIIHVAENSETGELYTNKTSVQITNSLGAYYTIDIEESTDRQLASGEEVTVNATIRNIGDGLGVSNIDFSVNGNVVDTNEQLVLTSGNEQTITFNTTLEEPGEYDISVDATSYDGFDSQDSIDVNVVDDAFYDVNINEANSTLNVVEDETVVVNTTVENTVNIDGDTQQINLTVGDEVVANKSVTLTGGESTTFDLEWDTSQTAPGTYDATVASTDDTDSADVTIREAAEFNVTNLDPAEATVATGDTIDVSANVTNLGEATGTQTIELRIGGEVVDSKSETIDGGNSTTVTFTNVQVGQTTGTFEYGVFSEDDSATGNLTVVEQLTAIDISLDTTSNIANTTSDYEINATVTSDAGGETIQNITVDFGTPVELSNSQPTVTLPDSMEFSPSYDSVIRGESELIIPLPEPVEIGTDVTEDEDITILADAVQNPSNGTYTLSTEFSEDDGTQIAANSTTYTIVEPANITLGIADDSVTEVNQTEPIQINATVSNDGGVAAERTITFELTQDGETVFNDSQTVNVASGATEQAEFTYLTTADDRGNFTATVTTQGASESTNVTVNRPAEFDVDIGELTDEVVAGDEINVTAEIENLGDLDDTQTIRLLANGTAVNSTALTLAGGENQTISLKYETNDDNAGDLNLTVASADDTDTRNVIVLQPAILSYGNFSVNGNTSDFSVESGTTLAANATVTNVGGVNGTFNATLFEGGEPTSKTENGTLAPEETANVSFTITLEENQTTTLSIRDAVRAGAQTDEIAVTVRRDVVDLNLTANRTEVNPGDPVNLTVRREDTGNLTSANVTVRAPNGTIIDTGILDGSVVEPAPDEPGTYEITATKESTETTAFQPDTETIDVLAPGNITITDAFVNVSETFTDDPVGVNVTLENIGDEETTEAVNLTLQGSETDLDNRSVTLGPGNNTTISLQAAFDSPGSRTLVVSEGDGITVTAGTVNILPQSAVTGFTVAPKSVAINDSVVVNATVRNRGTTPDQNVVVPLFVNETRVNSTTIDSIGRQQTKTVTFNQTLNLSVARIGNVPIRVGNLTPKSVVVSRETVPLDITASPATITTEESVTFTVTRAGTPVESATVIVAGEERTTGPNGNVTVNITEPGTFTAEATKAPGRTEFFTAASTTVEVVEPADIEVTGATLVSEPPFYAGNSITVEVDLQNDGDRSDTRTVNLTANGTVESNTSVFVPAGDTNTTRLSATFNDTVTRTLAVESREQNLTVADVTVERAAAVTGFDLSSTALQTGETLFVNSTVVNRGGVNDTVSVNVTIDGPNETVVNETEVKLEPGEEATVSNDTTFTTTGTASVVVNDSATVFGPREVAISQTVVDLNISANESTVTAGRPIRFNVTNASSGEPLDATVSVGDTVVTTGDDGLVTTSIRVAGTYSAVASKQTEDGTAYNSAQTSVTVSNPLTVNDTVSYGSVNASPVTGESRADTATAVRTVTLNNTGGRAIALSLPQTIGNASQYVINESTFPSRLPANSTRKVEIAFAPTTRDEVNSTFRFRADTPSDPIRTVNLTGTGEAPQADFSRTRLRFGPVNTGSSSTASIDVTNTGNEPLNVTVPSPAAGFTRTTAETLTIAQGSSETITIEFAPNEPREYGQILTIETNDSFHPTEPVRLSGTGRGGAIAVSPAAGSSIDVGNVTQGEPVETTVFVENNGTESIDVTSDVTAGDTGQFTATDPGTIAAGSTALVTVTVNATSSSPTADITLNTAAGDVDDPTLTVTANGLTPIANVTDPSGTLDFGSVSQGGSASEQITIRNDGEAMLEVDAADAVPVSAPFRVSGTGQSDTVRIPPDQTRTVTVTYAPIAPGTASSTVTLTTNDLGNRTLEIDVSGTSEATDLEGSPSSVDFGQVGQGDEVTETVTLTNPASNAESLEEFSVESVTGARGAYSVVSDLPDTLAPGSSENVTVRFEPTAIGPQSASITFAANGSDVGTRNRFTVATSGEGTPPRVALNTTALQFGYVDVNGGTVTEGVRIINPGLRGTTLNVSDVSISGNGAENFSVTDQPTQTVGGNFSTTTAVSFTPDTAGRVTATLTIRTNATDDPVRNVTLTGVGTAPDTGVDVSSIDFGEQAVGTTSENRTVVVTNDGGVRLNLSGVTVSGPAASDFEAFGPGETTLVPGATVRVPVQVSPSGAGATQANLAINATNDPGDNQTVSLSADGTAPELNVSDDLNETFGDVREGSSKQRSLTVENTGNATLELDAPDVTGGAFSVVSGDEAVRLAPGSTQTYTVAFSPESTGTFSGSLQIETNADNDVDIGSLSGTGITSNASLSTPAVDFGRVSVGDDTSRQLTLQNNGEAELQVTSVTITGADQAAFSVSGLPTTSIPADSGEPFTVQTSPSVTGSLSAQLEIRTDDGTLTASLGTTGTEPNIELEQSTVQFAQTRVGTTSTATLTVSNTGNERLNVTRLSVLGQNSGRFTLASSAAPFTLQPQSSRDVTVEFTPTNVTAAQNEQPRSARVLVRSDDPDATRVSADLTATGKATDLIAPGAVQFGATAPGTTTNRTVTITNGINASANLSLEAVTVSGILGEDVYSVDRPDDTELAPGESETLNVSLSPEERGVRFGSLNVLTNDPRQSAASVFLSNAEAVINIEFGSVTADYDNVAPGLQPERTFDQGLSTDAALTGIQPATQASTYELFFEGQETAFGGASIDSDQPYTAVRYLRATPRGITPSEITNVSLEFRVRKAALDDLGASADDVRLYRYNGSGYEPVSDGTTRVSETRTDYIYRGTTDSLSRFAIVVGESDLSVTDLTVNPTSITVGDSATLTANVTNNGVVSGTTTLTPTENGNALTSQSVTVSAGGSDTVSFSVNPSSTGTFTYILGGETASLTVDPEDTGPTGPTGPTGGDGDDDAPVITEQPATPEPVSATADLDETGTATVSLSGGTGATSVSVNVPDTTGQVNVQELPSPPTDAPAPTGQYVSGVDIDAPDPPEGQTATVTITISQSRLDDLGISAGDLVIQHYRDGAWQQLETTASESGDQVTLSAPVTGFSPFAVTTREQVTDTPEPVTDTAEPDTPTPEPDTDTDTPTDTPQEPGGFEFLPVALVVIILLAAAGYLVYRQQ